jgi:DNA replication protein DnaC
MISSNFGNSPRLIDRGMAECSVPGHGQFELSSVEQFDGEWKDTACPRCRWLALNTHLGSLTHKEAVQAMQVDQLNADLFATGITPRFRGHSFDTFVTGAETAKVRALNICRKYAENFAENYRDGRALMLLGGIGNGKTHLSCAILQHIVRVEGASGLIVTAEAITQAVSDSYRSSANPSKSLVIAQLAAVDLLILDEVGMHTPKPGKDFTPGLLHEVIDARYQRVLPTILVSNQEREHLPDYIGPRAMDRLRENGGLLAPFTWASARTGGSA